MDAAISCSEKNCLGSHLAGDVNDFHYFDVSDDYILVVITPCNKKIADDSQEKVLKICDEMKKVLLI